jgi:hypothetical protein
VRLLNICFRGRVSGEQHDHNTDAGVCPLSLYAALHTASGEVIGQTSARHTSAEFVAYSSWLNQVEIWFSKIQRDLIARGIFFSVKDLERKIMRYIRSYNRNATPIKWSYKDASNRIKTALELNETVH